MVRFKDPLMVFLLVSALLLGVSLDADPKSSIAESPHILRSPGGWLFVSAEAVTALLENPLEPSLELSEEEKGEVRESFELALRSEQTYRDLGQLTESGCLLPPLHWTFPGTILVQWIFRSWWLPSTP